LLRWYYSGESQAKDIEVFRLKNQESKSIIKKQNPKLGSEINGLAHVTDATFNSVIKKNPVVLIDFWADWCGPCKALAPIIERLAEDYRGRVFVGKLDIDKNPITADRFKVSCIPTLLFFKNGKKVDIIDDDSKRGIETALKKHLDDSQTITQSPKRRDKT